MHLGGRHQWVRLLPDAIVWRTSRWPLAAICIYLATIGGRRGDEDQATELVVLAVITMVLVAGQPSAVGAAQVRLITVRKVARAASPGESSGGWPTTMP